MTQTTAIDTLSGLSAASSGAKRPSPAEVERVAAEFEALLLKQLTASLNVTNDDNDEDSLFGGDSGLGLSKQMFSEEMASTMAKAGGIGLRDILIAQLTGKPNPLPNMSAVQDKAFSMPSEKQKGFSLKAISEKRPLPVETKRNDFGYEKKDAEASSTVIGGNAVSNRADAAASRYENLAYADDSVVIERVKIGADNDSKISDANGVENLSGNEMRYGANRPETFGKPIDAASEANPKATALSPERAASKDASKEASKDPSKITDGDIYNEIVRLAKTSGVSAQSSVPKIESIKREISAPTRSVRNKDEIYIVSEASEEDIKASRNFDASSIGDRNLAQVYRESGQFAKNTQTKNAVRKPESAPVAVKVSAENISAANDRLPGGMTAITVKNGDRLLSPADKKVVLNYPVSGRISSGFGTRTDPFTGKHRNHAGLDIAVPRGTPVGAAADGIVVFAGYTKDYGNSVVIEHADGRRTRYAHAETLFVTEGQEVKSGQTIAAVGSTGRSTGAHLHFEVIENGKRVNPLKALTNAFQNDRR